MTIFDTSILYAYESSTKLGYEVPTHCYYPKQNQKINSTAQSEQIHLLLLLLLLQVKDLLLPENIREIGLMVRKQFELEAMDWGKKQ